MAVIQHNLLPSVERIRQEGFSVIDKNDRDHSLPLLRIGILNMMPDKALSATERQLIRLLGNSMQVDVEVYLFTIPGIARSQDAQDYVNQYYLDFDAIKRIDLNAMIISGANVTQAKLTDELFWSELEQVIRWSQTNMTSTVCSCLATHAACKVFYGLDRKHLGDKCWGVYEHVVAGQHPLLDGVVSHLEMCHSRFNDISKQNFLDHQSKVLIYSEQVGVQLAVDEQLNLVFLQGHPEYDDISLLKEYKREVFGYVAKHRDTYPPLPYGYFDQEAQTLLDNFKQRLLASDDQINLLAEFPETQLASHITNSWQSAAQKIFSNWLNILSNN